MSATWSATKRAAFALGEKSGIAQERARNRALLVARAERIRGAHGWFVPDDAYEAILSGEMEAAEEPRREGDGA